jgi:hypothetical protein
MTSADESSSPRAWPKDLLNGFVAWLVAFVLYLIPGFVVAIPMGFSLGPKLKDNAAVGAQIGQAVSDLYRSHLSLHFGYIIVLGLLILWRARVTRRTTGNATVHGALIAVAPLFLAALPFAAGGHVLLCAIAAVVVLAAGIGGSITGDSRTHVHTPSV